jgi:hypothetical protein
MSPTDGLTSESALVVLVPEAEPLVGPFRERYDPSASAGMPAHITINYPFLPMEPNWYVALERLDEVLGALFLRFVASRMCSTWPPTPSGRLRI